MDEGRFITVARERDGTEQRLFFEIHHCEFFLAIVRPVQGETKVITVKPAIWAAVSIPPDFMEQARQLECPTELPATPVPIADKDAHSPLKWRFYYTVKQGLKRTGIKKLTTFPNAPDRPLIESELRLEMERQGIHLLRDEVELFLKAGRKSEMTPYLLETP